MNIQSLVAPVVHIYFFNSFRSVEIYNVVLSVFISRKCLDWSLKFTSVMFSYHVSYRRWSRKIPTQTRDDHDLKTTTMPCDFPLLILPIKHTLLLCVLINFRIDIHDISFYLALRPYPAWTVPYSPWVKENFYEWWPTAYPWRICATIDFFCGERGVGLL